MTASYAWIKLVHVLAALWVAAGIFGSTVVRAQGKRATALPERAMAARLLWRLHVVYSVPGVLLAGLVGFYLVSAGGFRFNELWVMLASMLYLLLFLSTLFLVTPGLLRQKNAAVSLSTGGGAPGAEAALGAKLPGILSDVNALLVVVLVLLMVTKP